MFYSLVIVCLTIGIIFWISVGYEDKKFFVPLAIIATIFTACAIILLMVQVKNDYYGYGTEEYHLPIHGVCEIVYVGDEVTTIENTIYISFTYYPTLIKLPDDQLRLFNLDQKMELGLVKVMPDYHLSPFLPIPAGNPFP